MAAVPGVEKAEVDFDAKTAKVTVKEGTDTTKIASALSGKYKGAVQ